MYAVIVAVLALAAAAQALPSNWNGRGGYESVKNIHLPTINEGNQVHKSESWSQSRSRKDTYSNSESASLVNKYQDVVKSDTYVHRNTNVYKPLTVNNHHHHHQTDIVKKIQPIQNNLWVEEKQKIVEPEEAQVNTYSKSVSRETIVKPTIVNNDEEKIRLPTKVLPTKWVSAGGNRGGYDNDNNEWDK